MSDTQMAARAVAAMLAATERTEDELNAIDAVCGDGDHGAGMVRGFRAAAAVPSDGLTSGAYLAATGAAFADAAGGSSGALVGGFMQSVGWTLGDDTCDPRRLASALSEGLATLCDLGRAKPGDRTMVDAWDPFVTAYAEAAERGVSLPEAWRHAVPAAQRGAKATVELPARRGRAAKVAGRGVGSPDAGAVSASYLVLAVADVLDGRP